MLRVPTFHEALESSGNDFPLDFAAYAFTSSAALGATGGNRDSGMMARGYLLNDRLEYAAGVFAGLRDAASQNDFRRVVRLQYNFFDRELYPMPSYAGANFGAKKILAIGAAYDTQEDYQGQYADIFADIPTSFGSAMGEGTFQHLDGGKFSPVVLAESNLVTVDGGLYFKGPKTGVWARYEKRDFSTVKNRDEHRIQAGVNHYVYGNILNFKLGVGRLSPAVDRDRNQATLQLNFNYY